MSGHATTGMYTMRPVVVLSKECPQSRCMYEMRSIHKDRCEDPYREAADTAAEAKMPDGIGTQVNRLLQASLPEYSALEARQEKILGQLAELKKQVTTLSHFLKQSNQAELTKKLLTVQKPVTIELVLNVPPHKPPYSILALQKLWKDTNFRVQSYIHSSIINQTPPNFLPHTTDENVAPNIVNLKLMWKEVPDIQFCGHMHQYPILGEVNFLRFMSRIIESHNYERTCLQPHTLDYALDYIHVLHYQKCIDKGLQELADKFDKWSFKGGFNIVDIAMWSLIKQFPGTRLPPALSKWYTQCESTFRGNGLVGKS